MDERLARPAVTPLRAAAILGCGRSFVHKLLKSGRLEGYRLGKRAVRIYLDSLATYQGGSPLGGEPYADGASKSAAKGPQRPGKAHREAMAYLRAAGVLGHPGRP